MDWKLSNIVKETEHRFLNFFVFTYEVDEGGVKSAYPYFLASRREKEDLVALSKGPLSTDAVHIVAVKEDEKDPALLLISVFRPALNRMVIELPAGLVDKSDGNLLETARRECAEETGAALVDAHVLCPTSPSSSGLSDEMVAVVEGKVSALGETALERFEDAKAQFVPFSKLRALLEDETKMIGMTCRLVIEILLARSKA